jgi:hypothetical protein
MLPGVVVTMGTREWIIPPLTLGQLRRLTPELGKINTHASMLNAEVIAAMVKTVTAALQRNYPELAEEAVEEMLDLGNAGKVLNAVLAGSGLGRGAAPGEAGAASDGTSFMASLPPAWLPAPRHRRVDPRRC